MNIDELQAGRELDALIAEVMGKPFRKPTHGNCCTCQVCGHYHDECQCGYGDDISMAWRVFEKMPEFGFHLLVGHGVARTDNQKYGIDNLDDGVTVHVFHKSGKSTDYDAVADAGASPLAICRAALKAVGVRGENET